MKQFFSSLIYDVFLASFTVLMLSLLIETQWKGAVVQWVNLNIVLITCIASGIVSVLLPKEIERAHSGIGYWIGSLFMSAIAGFIAYKQSAEKLGDWALAFALGVGLIIVCISAALTIKSAKDSEE